tara:strand:+ start:1872 stop:2342 length:471 start_codon:yes stop_codon:yes gene_type:complete
MIRGTANSSSACDERAAISTPFALLFATNITALSNARAMGDASAANDARDARFSFEAGRQGRGRRRRRRRRRGRRVVGRRVEGGVGANAVVRGIASVRATIGISLAGNDSVKRTGADAADIEGAPAADADDVRPRAHVAVGETTTADVVTDDDRAV